MRGWPPWEQHLSLVLSISLVKLHGSSLKEEATVASSHYKPQKGAENMLLHALSSYIRLGYFQVRVRCVLSEQIDLGSSGCQIGTGG